MSKAVYTLTPSDPTTYGQLPHGSLYRLPYDPKTYSKQGLPAGLDDDTKAVFLSMVVVPLVRILAPVQ